MLRWAERRNEARGALLLRHTAMDAPESRALAGGAFPSYFISPRGAAVGRGGAGARGRWR